MSLSSRHKPQRLGIGLIGLALILAASHPHPAQSVADCAIEHAPGIALVRYHASTLTSDRSVPPNAHLLSAHLGTWLVSTPIGQECATVESLRRDPRVAYAELDYAVHATEVITPNDPGLSHQWALTRIDAPAAWTMVAGAAQVVIAVIDSGLKLDHEDLASKVWTNPGEVPGNGLDDDGHGQIDDVHGWHFYHGWTGTMYVPMQDANVADDCGHGTHAAGIIGAATNNGVGIAGVAWGARVMPIKVLNQYGDGWYSDIAAGILYAADNGARIINLSLGGEEDSRTLRDAVDYARGRGALVIAAAGNSGGAVYYPAAYAPVLAVAATDANDQAAAFSNAGPQVDIAAPGVDIYSTWPWVTGYFTKSGTSMAAPHVAGVAALVWSKEPALTAEMVADLLARTAVDVGAPGRDDTTGWGRLDAFQAVRQAALYRTWLALVRR